MTELRTLVFGCMDPAALEKRHVSIVSDRADLTTVPR